LAQPAEFGELVRGIAGGCDSRGHGLIVGAHLLHPRRQHQIYSQQAKKSLGVFVLASIREPDAALRVLLEKIGEQHFNSTRTSQNN